MAIGTMGVGGDLSFPNFKGRGADPPQKKRSLSLEVLPRSTSTRSTSLQSYTCLNPMIIVKLASKVQKNMFERAKKKSGGGGGRVP